jgi:AcrR family transcriptional regulator
MNTVHMADPWGCKFLFTHKDTMATARPSKPRATYHHGDLRATLVEAGLALAREGGPQAVVLREATRRAGVAPNAAYRHFSGHQALFEAVRAAALGALARAIEREMAPAEALPDPAERARALLAAVGRGYLGFAQAETGWFLTAFASGAFDVEVPTDPARAADKGLNPFELLNYALDAMVQAGVLPAERRPGAEFLAWSSVHGMAAGARSCVRLAAHMRHGARAGQWWSRGWR